ncbi:MAG: hypothetical protein ACR2PH_07735, partial [Desulfobulbia bacterium]
SKYLLKVSDNNRKDTYGPFNSKAELSRERAQIIRAYNYDRKHGFTRETDHNSIVFRHAIYSTVIFYTMGTS